MKLTRWLTAGLILLLSFYSIGFAFGFIDPSPKNVLPLVLFIVCYGAYFAYPFFEEKWIARKQTGKTARREPRQDTIDVPTVVDAALSRGRQAPSPSETMLNPAKEGSSRATVPNAELLKPSLPRAQAVEPQATIEPKPPSEPSTDPPATILASSEPNQLQRQVSPALVRERIRIILEQLDQVSAFPELIPPVEALFDVIPEAHRTDLSKRPRTLAEHLFIARLFARSGLSEEAFSELTDEGIPKDKRKYSQPVSVATLQDAKRELRWLQDYARGVDASHP